MLKHLPIYRKVYSGFLVDVALLMVGTRQRPAKHLLLTVSPGGYVTTYQIKCRISG